MFTWLADESDSGSGHRLCAAGIPFVSRTSVARSGLARQTGNPGHWCDRQARVMGIGTLAHDSPLLSVPFHLFCDIPVAIDLGTNIQQGPPLRYESDHLLISFNSQLIA